MAMLCALVTLALAPAAHAGTPTAAWSSPAASAALAGSATLTCASTGSPTVTKMEFSLVNVGVLGADLTAPSPWTYAWNTATVADGAYTLRCRSFNGVWSAYVSRSFSVDNTAATSSITSPSTGTGLATSPMTVQTSATDATGVISASLYVDGVQNGSTQTFASATSKTNTFSVDMTALSVGPHTMYVRYVDAVGNAGNSATTTFYRDLAAPVASIAAPTAGEMLTGTPTWSVLASDDAGITRIEWYVDGATLRNSQDMSGTLPTGAATYGFAWVTAAESDGAHSLTAKVFDTAGNITTTAAVGVTVDKTAPSASSVDSPASGSYQSGTITIGTSGADSVGVVSAALLVDGIVVETQAFTSTTSTSRNFSWNTVAAGAGAHSITVRYADQAGNTTDSTTITLTADNASPTASITAPTGGAYARGTTSWTVAGTDDSGVTRVEWFLDGVLRTFQQSPTNFTAATSVTRTFSWASSGATQGAHTLTAKTYDGTGNVTTSAPVSITVDNVAPSASTIDSPATGSSQQGSITVSTSGADAIGLATAELYVDGALADSAAATGLSDSVDFTLDTTALTSAAHSLVVRYVDLAGGTTDSTATTINVDQTAPTVSVTAPVSGASFPGDFTFTVQADDDGGVTTVRWYVDGVLNTSQSFASTTSTTRSITVGAALSQGSHTIAGEAVDWTGKVTATANSTVTIDTTNPTTAGITAPLASDHVQGSALQPYVVTADGSDNLGLASASFYLDSTLAFTDVVSGASDTATWSWNTAAVANGTHTLRVRFVDGAGNYVDSGNVSITVDNTDPGGSITNPLNGATVRNPLNFNVSATDNYGVERIEWYIDTTLLDTQTFTPTTSTTKTYVWNPMDSAEGLRVLTAKIYDRAGNVKTTAGVTVNVSYSVPCTYDPDTDTITMSLDVGNVASLSAESSGKIRSGASSYCTGGSPIQYSTVSNTSTIVVTGSTGDEVLTINRAYFTTQAFQVALGTGTDTLKVSMSGLGVLAAGRNDVTGKDLVGWGSVIASSISSSIEMTGVDSVQLNGSTGNDELTGEFYYAGSGHTCGACDMPDPADYPLVLNGGKGGDRLVGGRATDIINGGDNGSTGSYDEVRYVGRSLPIAVSLDNLANDGEALEGDNVKSDVENVIGGDGDDSITGSASGNVLRGGPGGDTLSGGDGADVLYGHWTGAGTDGSDSYAGGNGNDSFYDGSNAAGGETFSGGAGTDSARLEERDADDLSISLDGVANDGATGENDNVMADVENVRTGNGDDTLTGSALANVLDGGAGSDTFNGGAGNDTLKKSDINALSSTPGDVVNGGDGTDTSMIWYSEDTASITVRIDGIANDGRGGEADNIGTDVETVYAAKGNDTFVGSVLANRFYGGAGNDSISGGDGNDYLNGQSGDDTITGGSGNDKLLGDYGDDLLTGNAGTDSFAGSYGDDVIYSADGLKETVNGGPGSNDSAHRDSGLDVVSYVEAFF